MSMPIVESKGKETTEEKEVIEDLQFSVPRLELMAAVLSTKLAVIIRKELVWSFKKFFWTDSNIH